VLTSGTTPHANATFRTFYRQKGLRRPSERVHAYQSKLGVQPTTVRVLELRHCWGSYTRQGMPNFQSKCMMALLTVLDSIVVHELAHLPYPNHTAAF
jgi:predicted metal-dependent hydrolase